MEQRQDKTRGVLFGEREAQCGSDESAHQRPVGHHDPFRKSGGAAGIHQDRHIFFHGVAVGLISRCPGKQVFVEVKAGSPVVHGYPFPDMGKTACHLHGWFFISVAGKEYGGFRIIDDLDNLGTGQSEVERGDADAELACCKVDFKVLVSVLGKDRQAVFPADIESFKSIAEPIDALVQLQVSQRLSFEDDRGSTGETPG
ncbi:hypothetical protein SBDP1_20010 [Syntrophobacter sp. SbD1]|nr:hypothetical protein SBDP1_20010 [Syntrophobacter sp. SbD1]